MASRDLAEEICTICTDIHIILTCRGKELVRIPRKQGHSNEAEGAKQFHIYLRIGEWVRQYICDITSSLALLKQE